MSYLNYNETSRERIALDAVDTSIIGNNFAFFGNAMTVFCLVLHIILDLKPEIVNALYAAKDRVCVEMNSRGGNYGLDDKRSNLSFMLVLTDFIAEINRAYMLAFAERITTADFLQILDKYPSTGNHSSLWLQLHDIRYQAQKARSAPDSDDKITRKGKSARPPTTAAAATGLAAAAPVTTGTVGRPRKICKFFAEHGHCRHGSSCKYSHEPPAAKL
jgi:hypothetical protein